MAAEILGEQVLATKFWLYKSGLKRRKPGHKEGDLQREFGIDTKR